MTMKIILAAIPTSDHLNPALAIARILINAGNQAI
jgi:UDP:flavonoid glycosyltransferase YjiC (YdhE family)